jgi:hypothetical protein
MVRVRTITDAPIMSPATAFIVRLASPDAEDRQSDILGAIEELHLPGMNHRRMQAMK